MADNRRMTTDRFFGGVEGRLGNLQEMLSFVAAEDPSEEELVTWVIDNTHATSENAVRRHLQFIQAIDLVEKHQGRYQAGEYGEVYLVDNDVDVLYEALRSGVKGFQTILHELDDGPLTDEDIMDLLVTTYDDCNMTSPGPAIRHREWLQAIEYLERDGNFNRITDKGRSALRGMTDQELIEDLQRQLRQSDMQCVPAGVQSLTNEVYPAIQSAYPSLCDDSYRCEEAHDGGKDQAEWKHAVRNVLKQLADDELSRVRRRDDHGRWLFSPRFTPGMQYRRQDLHDRYDGKEQSGISPSKKVPVVFVFTGDTADLYGYEDTFKEDGTLVYTGEGQVGPQTYDHGNKALAEHGEDGRELHVFEKNGDGLVTYIGQYVLEGWDWETLPDKNRDDRQAIQFELRPIEEATLNSVVVLPKGNPNPKRVQDSGTRTQRDTDLVNRMKRLYNDTCQLCGDRRLQGEGIGFSYVHHIKPLAPEHSGPDVPENVIVLCPNHHDDFDNGMLTVDPDTLAITHAYEDDLAGTEVMTKRGHEIDPQFLAYHNQTIAQD